MESICCVEVFLGSGRFTWLVWSEWPYSTSCYRFSTKAKFTSRSVGVKKEEKPDKKDDAKKAEKDGKDEKEGKEKDDQKAGSCDRSRASKSGNSSCLSTNLSKTSIKSLFTALVSQWFEISQGLSNVLHVIYSWMDFVF